MGVALVILHCQMVQVETIHFGASRYPHFKKPPYDPEVTRRVTPRRLRHLALPFDDLPGQSREPLERASRGFAVVHEGVRG